MKQIVLSFLIALAWVLPAKAADLDAPFENIDGGELQISQWAGQPVLVVNTASRCGFTKQYAQMQTLYDRYRDQGLVVLAVPSNDFRQELSTEAEVKDFCEVQFGLDLPMTGITSVKGKDAHPFFQTLRAETGFRPNWNFNKVLVGPDGEIVKTFGSKTTPLSSTITSEIEALLGGT